MPFLRKKQITLDGITVTIGSILSCEAEEMFTAQREIFDQPETTPESKLIRIRKSWDDFIAKSLTRGEAKPAPEGGWSAENIHKEFDKGFLALLLDEIREMNGVGVVKGEVKAPSTSPS